MTGTLKHDEAAGYIVEYQHQLSTNVKQRKELQLHPDDMDLISSFAPEEEVSFYIVENQKMSGVVQYAKLIRESHSDQVIDIMNDEKLSEISDEKIEKAARDYNNAVIYGPPLVHFEQGAFWYREQKTTLYTEEQLRQAISIAKDSMGVNNDGETCYSHLSTEQIIQSLNQPKKD